MSLIKRFLPLLILSLLAAAVLAGCGSKDPSAGGTSTAQANSKQAPDFYVETLDGTMTSLSDMKGKPLVINFGASWCGPCQLEAPVIASMYNKYKDRVNFFGMAVQDRKEDALAFAHKSGFTYRIGLDPNGDVAYDYQKAAKVPYGGIPMTIFINRNGDIVDYYLGPLNEQQFEQRVSKILN